MQVGDVIQWTRIFHVHDVDRFTEVVFDDGAHHAEPDVQGRKMVHGLLTASPHGLLRRPLEVVLAEPLPELDDRG